jgi:multidrug efflux pump
MGLGFIRMKDCSERPEPGQDIDAVATRAMGASQQIREAMAFALCRRR